MKGGAKVIVEPHRHEGIFIAKQKEDVLVTRNMVVGESVYGEKRISVEQGDQKIEYRVWNPFRCTPSPCNYAHSVVFGCGTRPHTVATSVPVLCAPCAHAFSALVLPANVPNLQVQARRCHPGRCGQHVD
jgi:hypothetical protein